MNNRGLKHIMDDAGQTLVEFALIVALFLAILFGIIEFGRAWFYSNHLSNSVRATARYAAVLNNISTTGGNEVLGYLGREIDEFMPAEDIDWDSPNTYVKCTTCADPDDLTTIVHGDTLEVSVEYDFHVLSGSIIPYFSGERPIIRKASMQFE